MANVTLVYVGPADKLDLRPVFGDDSQYVMYPLGSPLAGTDGAEAGREVDFTAEQVEELTTNPALSGHKFTKLTSDELSARKTDRKKREERRARLEKAAAKSQQEARETQQPLMLNGMPVSVMGAAITEPDGSLTKESARALEVHSSAAIHEVAMPANNASRANKAVVSES